MGIHERGYYREYQSQFSWSAGPTWSGVNSLIAINLAVFLVDILSRGFGFDHGLMGHLAVRWSDFLSPLTWPRFLTYGFAHAPLEVNAFHILFNMLMLWVFGRTVEAAIGKTRFLTMYLSSILICSILSMIYYRLMGSPTSLLGASGAVATITIFFVFMAPDSKLMLYGVLEMPAWVLGAGFIVMNLLGAFSQTIGVGPPSNTAYATHLIGIALGFLFFRFGIPGGDWLQSVQQWNKKRKFRVIRAQEEKEQKVADNADEILDKVHRDGYDSLSKQEKATLEKYSRQIKDKQ